MKRAFLIFFLFGKEVKALDDFLYLGSSSKKIGIVTAVRDGDTIDVNIGNESILVRLLSIDAPEFDEPFFEKAKAFTKSLLNQSVELYYSPKYKFDKHNRLLAVVVHNGKIFNIKLLRAGLARRMFIYNDIIKFPRWETEEVYARKKKINIWSSINSYGIFINEINVNPYPEEDKEAEFVELYNGSGRAVDVGSFSFVSVWKKMVIPPETVIPKNGYLIIARTNPTRFREIYPHTPKEITIIDSKDNLVLPNNWNPKEGLVIYLIGKDKSYQDALTYNLEWDNGKANGTGKTLCRKSIFITNVGDSRVGGEDDMNWDASLKEKGSPGRANLEKPMIWIDPIEGFPNDTITIRGEGFFDDEEVNLYFSDIKVATIIPKDGKFEEEFTALPKEPGSITITAYSSHDFATATFFLYRVIIDLKKTSDKKFVNIGDIITYSIYYRNIGNYEGTNVVIYDYFPENTEYISHTGPKNVFVDRYGIKFYIGTLRPFTDMGSVTLRMRVIK